jgi:hypothetical protein
MIYTRPSTGMKELDRVSYKMLLPPVLKTKYFEEFLEGCDATQERLESDLVLLENIRNPYTLSEELDSKIGQHAMLDISDWPVSSVIQNQLNFVDATPGGHPLVKLSNMSRYWRQKSKAYKAFAEFCGE